MPGKRPALRELAGIEQVFSEAPDSTKACPDVTPEPTVCEMLVRIFVNTLLRMNVDST